MAIDKSLRGGQFETVYRKDTISLEWVQPGPDRKSLVLATVDTQLCDEDFALEQAFAEFQRHLMSSFLKHRLGFVSVRPGDGPDTH
jgi:hypothetical protein